MNELIAKIRTKVAQAQFEFSKHALDQAMLRGISVHEIREAIQQGIVIEDYRHDKYGPSCLVFGLTALNRPLHVQCSYPSRPLIKIITVYQPNPREWIDDQIRR